MFLNDGDQIVLLLIEEMEQHLEYAVFERVQTVKPIVNDIGVDGVHKEVQKSRNNRFSTLIHKELFQSVVCKR